MYTCEQCGAEFDYSLKSCELCNGPIQNNGRASYTDAPPPQTTTARYRAPEQYYEPQERRYLPPASRYLPPQEPQQPYNEYLPPRDSYQQQRGTAENFRRLFGLHPAVAAIAIITGGALQAGELVCLFPALLEFEPIVFGVAACAAFGLAVITYLAQQEYAGDSKRSAGIKALMVGFLTALPGGVLGYKKLSKIIEELKT